MKVEEYIWKPSSGILKIEDTLLGKQLLLFFWSLLLSAQWLNFKSSHDESTVEYCIFKSLAQTVPGALPTAFQAYIKPKPYQI